MKIIHQGGYPKEELAMHRLTIYKNVIDCAKALIAAMRQFEITPELEENIANCEYLENYNIDPDPHSALDARVATSVSGFWADPCIAKVMEHSSEFYLMDSAP
jgi:guanine nucleotide-binding protein G(i) subunit alpha